MRRDILLAHITEIWQALQYIENAADTMDTREIKDRLADENGRLLDLHIALSAEVDEDV